MGNLGQTSLVLFFPIYLKQKINAYKAGLEKKNAYHFFAKRKMHTTCPFIKANTHTTRSYSLDNKPVAQKHN